ncbi:unnamed protein product [Trichobilharzia regenti]|nr:unnamed protein product [Trichobilharzia regenti]
MENLKELLDAEQEKVTKLKALIIKERKVNTKMKAELEHLKSQHTADNQCSSKSVERVDKSCCTSEYSNAATSTNTTQTTDFDVLSELPYTSNKDFQEKRHENIPTIYSPSNTHKVLNSINNKIVSPCMIESSSFCDDKVCSTGKNLQMSCVKQLTIAPDDDFPTHLQNSSVDCHGEQCSSILKQFNLALKSLKLHEKNILSKGELESVFDECKKMVEKSDWCSSSIEDLMADSLSFKSKINVSEDHCQGIQVPPNNHLSSCESRDMLLSCHCLHPSKDAQTITDAVCDELSVLEERVDGLKSWVERAEFSLNNLSNKLTSATYINERNDTKLCQLQATCFGSSDACELPSLQNTKTALIYDSFLVPLTEYYQEISNKHCELDVNHYISNSFENAHIDEKNIEMFLNKLKHIIKHYFESNVNAQNGQLTASLGARISDENENTDSQQNKLFLDKIKSIEYELSKANERAAISENSAEQQKKIVELQKSQTVNVEYTEELNLSEELSHIKKVKENLESTVAKLSSELTQQHALYESLLNEKRLTVDRFQKLQTEHAAYKIKAQHALCNARTHKNEVDSLCVNNNDSSGKQDDETIVNSRSSVESEGYFLTELEFVKKNLSDVQHRKEEAELHASLAQSECNLLKKELTDFKANHIYFQIRVTRQTTPTPTFE